MNQLKSAYNIPFLGSYSHPIHTCLSMIASNGPGHLYYPWTHSPITFFPELNSNTVTMRGQASINEFPENIMVS